MDDLFTKEELTLTLDEFAQLYLRPVSEALARRYSRRQLRIMRGRQRLRIWLQHLIGKRDG